MATNKPALDLPQRGDKELAPSAGFSATSHTRLLLLAVALPAFVAITNQLLLATIATHQELRAWFYPWIVLTTAALSWCIGRYLHPAWLGLIIFAWCLALLDLLTFIACLTGRVDDQLGYVLVSAQISLLTLWAVLGPGAWQSRLPSVAILVPLVAIFCGSFVRTSRMARSWNVTMFITAAVVLVLCTGLRYLGFVLRHRMSAIDTGNRPSYQFGMKHMLIWFTVSGPLLLLVRSLDFGGRGIFTGAVLAVAVATVNLIAIWAVLGGGNWIIRIAALLGAPYLIAQGMTYYSAYLKSAAIRSTSPLRYYDWYDYGSIAWSLAQMEKLWTTWLWLEAALLAALLLYLRASGYRLMRTRGATK